MTQPTNPNHPKIIWTKAISPNSSGDFSPSRTMAGFVRKKRVTDLFDDNARARLIGTDRRRVNYVSSGSQHSDDGDSPCLSELVQDFLEDDTNGDDSVCSEFDSERVDSVSDHTDSVEEVLRWNFAQNADPQGNLLLEHVLEAVEKFSYLRGRNVSVFRRSVVTFLREKGQNAAICMTQWDSAGGVTAGNHEFIDVVQSVTYTWRKRYFVDLDFRSQFEIAWPTRRYSEILNSAPCVFVGGEEELKRTVSFMCDVATRCFRSRGLSVPPWRKNRFMQNKWFAPSRRTSNSVQGNPVPAVALAPAVIGNNCRFVGFDDVVSVARPSGGVFVRTR